MKTNYSFGFTDQPEIRTPCASRQWLANYLRAARRNPYLRVRRVQRSAVYCFSILHPNSGNEAIILPIT